MLSDHFCRSPVISLKLLGINEIQGILTKNKFGDLDATQITFGSIDKNQIPDIDHQGRIRESLIPVNYEVGTVDRYNYGIDQSGINF